jgi:hypothetical protein
MVIQYSVCDPSPNPEFEQELQIVLPASLLGSSGEEKDLSNKVRNDPFNTLPYDILLDLFECVDTKDMLALMQASHHIDITTRETAFWKHMLRLRILPWFYELASFLSNTTLSDSIDYKGLFLWIDHLTRPEFGNQDSTMGMCVANRRRIWSAVQDLMPLYKTRTGLVLPVVEEDEEETKRIREMAVCLHTPMTMYPVPEGCVQVEAQFIRAWNEIRHAECDFDTYWARKEGPHSPGLVGIAVTFAGQQQRVFGSTEGVKGNPLHMEAEEWISSLVLLVDEVDLLNHTQDRSPWLRKEDTRPKRDACINGMQVCHLSSLCAGRGKEKLTTSRSSLQTARRNTFRVVTAVPSAPSTH